MSKGKVGKSAQIESVTDGEKSGAPGYSLWRMYFLAMALTKETGTFCGYIAVPPDVLLNLGTV